MIALTEQEARALCLKWARIIGLDFHPDTRGEDYEPRLCRRHVVDYEHDMARLFACEWIDPYEFGVEAIRSVSSNERKNHDLPCHHRHLGLGSGRDVAH